MNCAHKSCGSNDKVWLPFEVTGINKGLKSHPYCVRCGSVKNISSDRARSIGYYVNVLARMGGPDRRHHQGSDAAHREGAGGLRWF